MSGFVIYTGDEQFVVPECTPELHEAFGMNGTGGLPANNQSRLVFTDGFAGIQQPQTEEDALRAEMQREREKAIREGHLVGEIYRA